MLSRSRLPIANLDHAVALAACGFPISPKAYLNEKSGTRSLTWFCDGNISAAQSLLSALTVNDRTRRLDVISPESPVLAALAGIRSARVIAEWARRGVSAIPSVRRIGAGRLCAAEPQSALQPDAGTDLMRVLADRPAPASVPMHPAGVAALIVCGFVPSAVLRPVPGSDVPRVSVPAVSDTFSGLTVRSLMDVMQSAFREPRSICTAVPAGADDQPGRHPLCFALAALRFEEVFRNALPKLHEDPVVMMRGKGGRSALVSASLMRQGAPGNARDLVARHKAGLLR